MAIFFLIVKFTSVVFITLIISKSVYSSLPPINIKAPNVKVRVGVNIKDIVMIGTDLERYLYLTNNRKEFSGRGKIKFRCFNFFKNKLNLTEKSVLLASIESKTGLVSIQEDKGDKKYKGILYLVGEPSSNSCDIINEVNIESYLSSLLTKEVNREWPIELLKAQAIAARTYALYKIKQKGKRRNFGNNDYYYDLENTEKDQVSGDFFDTNYKTDTATIKTRGEVLVNQLGQLRPAFFHAKCGGKTLIPSFVWGKTVHGYASRECLFCKNRGRKSYRKSISIKDFKKFLAWIKKNKLIKHDVRFLLKEKLRIVPHTKFSRVIRIYLGGQFLSFKKSLLRRYFGRKIFLSNNFKLDRIERGKYNQYLKILGSGRGHGVGMCQLGALDLAYQGWDYKKILAYYYPYFSVKRIY